MARKRRNRGRNKDAMMTPPANMPMQGMMGGTEPMPMQGEPMGGPRGPGPESGGAGMAAPSPVPEGEEGSNEPEPNVSPEEQALYHKFMENYYTIMYVKGQENATEKEPPLVEQIRQMFDNAPDPIDALATATVTVVSHLSESAEAAGKPIPGDVLMHAGTEILSDLAELSENGGHHEYTEDEMSGALTKGMMLYKDLNAGKINMDEVKSDYEMLVTADKEGRLDDVLPGASEAARRMAPAQQEEMPPEPVGGAPTPVAAPAGFGRA